MKILAISLLVTPLEFKSFSSCNDGWIQLDNQCYYKSNREMDFYAAERFCRVRLASHLPILKDDKVANLYYNLLAFQSSPYDTWLGAIPLKQLNNSWKWLDGSDIVHNDMKERFIVDSTWGFSDDEPNILPNTTYESAINSIAAYHYFENLHCTLLILLTETKSGHHSSRFDFTKCDKMSHFYCQKPADIILSSKNVSRNLTTRYQSNSFLIMAVIALIITVVLLITLGFIRSNSEVGTSEARAFYSNE